MSQTQLNNTKRVLLNRPKQNLNEPACEWSTERRNSMKRDKHRLLYHVRNVTKTSGPWNKQPQEMSRPTKWVTSADTQQYCAMPTNANFLKYRQGQKTRFKVLYNEMCSLQLCKLRLIQYFILRLILLENLTTTVY